MTTLLASGINILRDIGGARVFRPFTYAGKRLAAGTELGIEELKKIPPTNLRVLIEGRFLIPWPKIQRKVSPNSKHFIIAHQGGGYDVILGEKLNEEPLKKDEALELAGHKVEK